MQCGKPDITAEESESLQSLQTQLDDVYLEKAKQAYVRSKAKWIEHGDGGGNHLNFIT